MKNIFVKRKGVGDGFARLQLRYLYGEAFKFPCIQKELTLFSVSSKWWGRTDSLFCGKATAGQTVHRTVCLDRPFESTLQMPKRKKRPIRKDWSFSGGGGRIRTIEAKRSRFTVCPLWPLGNSPKFSCSGAGRRTRTPDLLITNQLLYQLSYTGGSTEREYYTTGREKVKHYFYFLQKKNGNSFWQC